MTLKKPEELLKEWTTVSKNLTTEESLLEIDDMIEDILKYLVSQNVSKTTKEGKQ